MIENIKQEVNTVKQPTNIYSNFQRMLKNNMARSAAILALMSAPLMGTNATLSGKPGTAANISQSTIRGAIDCFGKVEKQFSDHPYMGFIAGGLGTVGLVVAGFKLFRHYFPNDLEKFEKNVKIINKFILDLNLVSGDVTSVITSFDKIIMKNSNGNQGELEAKLSSEVKEAELNTLRKKISLAKVQIDKARNMINNNIETLDIDAMKRVLAMKDCSYLCGNENLSEALTLNDGADNTIKLKTNIIDILADLEKQLTGIENIANLYSFEQLLESPNSFLGNQYLKVAIVNQAQQQPQQQPKALEMTPDRFVTYCYTNSIKTLEVSRNKLSNLVTNLGLFEALKNDYTEYLDNKPVKSKENTDQG